MKTILSMFTAGLICFGCADVSPDANSKHSTDFNSSISHPNLNVFPPNPTHCSVPPCDSAILACGYSNDVLVWAGGDIDGANHSTPPSNCTGSACTSPPIGSINNFDILAEDNLSVSSAFVTQEHLGNDTHCDGWANLYDAWIGTNACSPGVIYAKDSTYSGNNDCSDPKVYVFSPTSGTISITGNSYLCGTFFIDGNLTMDSTGTATLVGVVINMNRFVPLNNINLSSLLGTNHIIGKVVYNGLGRESQSEMNVRGFSDIHFSSSAVNYAQQALNNASSMPVSCDPAPTLF